MNDAIKKYIDKSVICWLATVSKNGTPNVSPKEVFTYSGDVIIIANIASPQSAKNIKVNPNVCVSFIDILVQKGYQLKGRAEMVLHGSAEFDTLKQPLLKITESKFPFSSIFKVTVESAKPIIAPKYMLYPETTEEEQIASAKKVYGL